jgi:hypothetical protein
MGGRTAERAVGRQRMARDRASARQRCASKARRQQGSRSRWLARPCSLLMENATRPKGRSLWLVLTEDQRPKPRW